MSSTALLSDKAIKHDGHGWSRSLNLPNATQTHRQLYIDKHICFRKAGFVLMTDSFFTSSEAFVFSTIKQFLFLWKFSFDEPGKFLFEGDYKKGASAQLLTLDG